MSDPIDLVFADDVVSQPDPQHITFEWGRGLFIAGTSTAYTMDEDAVVFGTPPTPDPDPEPEPEPEPEAPPDPFGAYAGVAPPRFSDPVPLLSTGPWSGEQDVTTLPAIYGTSPVTVRAVPYLTPRIWAVAGHACAAIAAVRVNGAEVDGWQQRNGIDAAGRTVCFIDFTEPQQDVEIEADVVGRIGPRSGAALSNPADIATDFLREICGYPLAPARLATYRQQATGISLAGTIASNQTIRAALDTIFGSAGAAWSGASPDFASTWPPAAAPASHLTLDARALDAVSSQTEGDPVSILHVEYDESVDGSPRRSLTLRAPIAARRFGGVERTLSLPWTRTERQAEMIGRRWLAYHARPVWRVEATLSGRVTAGQGVSLNHPLIPLTGPHPVVTVAAEPTALQHTITVEGAAGSPPLIERV